MGWLYKEYYERDFGLPFEELKANLKKILEQYGVSKENCEDWLTWGDFYDEILDKDGKHISERGKRLFEHFKDCLGDPIKEMPIEMYVID